jgi:hypothetical protein
MGIANWVQLHLPPALAEFLLRTKRSLKPSADYRRASAIHGRIGAPQTILAGPFAGMRYVDVIGHLPKVLGIYELELRPAVERMVALAPDVIVNVGTAEGYYAVGLARRLPDTRVIGYDIAALPRHRLAALSRLNDVESRVERRGYCSTEELGRVCAQAKRPAVVIDCEGAEQELLDPAKAPGLTRATVLVELHEMYRPGVTKLIESRFAPTHEILRYPSVPRTAADLPAGVKIEDPADFNLVVDERKEPQEWFLLVPRNPG